MPIINVLQETSDGREELVLTLVFQREKGFTWSLRMSTKGSKRGNKSPAAGTEILLATKYQTQKSRTIDLKMKSLIVK